MGSTHGNDGGSMLLPFGDDPPKDRDRVSAEPNVPLNSEHLQIAPPPRPVLVRPAEAERGESRRGMPLWARRLQLVVFVTLCVELGMLLIALPWSEVWTMNSIVAEKPLLRELATNYFVRGAISGLGLVNLWLGIWEAVTYRER